MPFPDGSYITQWRDLDRTCEEFAKFSKKDAAAYRRMHDENEATKSSCSNGNGLTPPGVSRKSVAERLAEHPQGKIWQRRLAMSQWRNPPRQFRGMTIAARLMMGTPPSMSPPQYPHVGPQRLFRDSNEPSRSKRRFGNFDAGPREMQPW